MGKKGAHSGMSPKDRSVNAMDKFIQRNDRKRQLDEKFLGRKKAKNIPIDLCCPISLEIMEDPVICSDGHTYDRKSILLLFKKNNPKSPKTRKILDKNILITNYNIKSIIENYKEF